MQSVHIISKLHTRTSCLSRVRVIMQLWLHPADRTTPDIHACIHVLRVQITYQPSGHAEIGTKGMLSRSPAWQCPISDSGRELTSSLRTRQSTRAPSLTTLSSAGMLGNRARQLGASRRSTRSPPKCVGSKHLRSLRGEGERSRVPPIADTTRAPVLAVPHDEHAGMVFPSLSLRFPSLFLACICTQHFST